MIFKLLVLGLALSMDNFRTAIALGALRLSWRRAVLVALAFGFVDGLAPLVGVLVGRFAAHAIGVIAPYVGAVVLAAYGLYLVIKGVRARSPEEPDFRWSLFSLPLPLSLDNVIAGTSLGLLGLSPWISPPTFGAITVVMSFVGLQLGRVASRFIRIRADLLSGVALMVMAVVLVFSP